METSVNMHNPRTNGKCLRCGSEVHCLQECTRPGRQRPSRSGKAKHEPKKEHAKSKSKGKSKGKGKKNKPSAKAGDVDFDAAENDMPEQEDTQEWAEEEPEVYFSDRQTSESGEESASECTD